MSDKKNYNNLEFFEGNNFNIILILVLLFLRKTPAPTDVSLSELKSAEIMIPSVTSVKPPPPPATREERVKMNAEQVAKIFMERFGSYSNQDKNGHITDVLPLVTSKMADYIKTLGQEYGKEYQGINTKVITTEVSFTEEGKATVVVGVQQILESVAGQKTVYKNGTVNLMQEGEDWKVDGLFWNK